MFRMFPSPCLPNSYSICPHVSTTSYFVKARPISPYLQEPKTAGQQLFHPIAASNATTTHSCSTALYLPKTAQGLTFNRISSSFTNALPTASFQLFRQHPVKTNPIKAVFSNSGYLIPMRENPLQPLRQFYAPQTPVLCVWVRIDTSSSELTL